MSIVTIQGVEDGVPTGDITYFELPEGVSGGVRRIGRRRGKRVKASEADFAKIQQAEQERLEREQERERIAFQKREFKQNKRQNKSKENSGLLWLKNYSEDKHFKDKKRQIRDRKKHIKKEILQRRNTGRV